MKIEEIEAPSTAETASENATRGKSDSKASISYGGSNETAWEPATLLNGWVDHSVPSFGVARYAKALGVVHIRGVVSSGTVGTVLTLPVGMRPDGVLVKSSVQNGSFVRINIETTGNVDVEGGLNTWVSIDMSFRV